jgi:hypothetical protein
LLDLLLLTYPYSLVVNHVTSSRKSNSFTFQEDT